MPESLKDSRPLVGSPDNILYVFVMTQKEAGHYYRYNGGQTVQTLGILTSKPIPDHKVCCVSSVSYELFS